MSWPLDVGSSPNHPILNWPHKGASCVSMWSTHTAYWSGKTSMLMNPFLLACVFVFCMPVFLKLYGSCQIISFLSDKLFMDFSYFPPNFMSVFSGLNHLISCCSATILSHFEPFGIFLINIIHLRWQKISLMKMMFNNVSSFMMKFKSPIQLGCFSLRFITFERIHNTASVVDLVQAVVFVHTHTCAVHVCL